MQAIMETIFEIFYLLVGSLASIFILYKGWKNNRRDIFLFGSAFFILVFGDAFHLIPRMLALNNGGIDNIKYVASLGLGKLITSVTMTIFYLIMYYFIKARYNTTLNIKSDAFVIMMVILRVVLCLLPQNNWFEKEQLLYFGITRNIPFIIIGIYIIALCFIYARKDKNFKILWILIILSFTFYLPVVLLASTYPLIGLLMLPKTICYLIILGLGLKESSKIKK